MIAMTTSNSMSVKPRASLRRLKAKLDIDHLRKTWLKNAKRTKQSKKD